MVVVAPAAPPVSGAPLRFPIRLQRPFGPILRIFGATAGKRAMVTLTARGIPGEDLRHPARIVP